MEYDVFVEEFREIVKLSEEILPFILILKYSGYYGDSCSSLSQHQQSSRFSYDIDFVVGLYLVGSRLRCDGKVRRRVIEMMLNTPIREGIWDAPDVGRVAEWIRGIEVEGMEDAERNLRDWMVPREKRANLNGY